jgi:branched-chain amino acid transport system permease protein
MKWWASLSEVAGWPARCCARAAISVPNVMGLHNSGFVVMMVLVGGGLVSFWGPLSALFFLLRATSSRTRDVAPLVGLIFMAMVLFKPRG